jgi:CheY-like chemotaxis protein
MPRGGTVRIRGSNIEAPPTPLPGGPYVIIEVEDDGVGIAEDSIGRVFDPYFSTKKDGSGLGLATAYSVVSRHDGLLTVESVEGQGAVFKIHLPAARKTAPSGQEQSVETAETSGRVLLMDDDESVRRVVLEILEHYGFAAAGAADGQEAITLYCDAMEQGCPFDVVIMDLTIPGGMNGKEAVQRLREIDPNLRAVAASGYHNDPVMAHYRENGFSDALGKPFEISELLRVLSTVLAEARQPAERGQ